MVAGGPSRGGGGWRARRRGQIEDSAGRRRGNHATEKKGISMSSTDSMRQSCQLHITPPLLNPGALGRILCLQWHVCLAAVCTLRRNGRHGVAFSFPSPPVVSEVTGEESLDRRRGETRGETMRINTPSYSPLFLPANHHPWFCIGSGRPSPSLSISSLPPPWRIQILPLLGCPPFGPHFVPRVPSDVS